MGDVHIYRISRPKDYSFRIIRTIFGVWFMRPASLLIYYKISGGPDYVI